MRPSIKSSFAGTAATGLAAFVATAPAQASMRMGGGGFHNGGGFHGGGGFRGGGFGHGYRGYAGGYGHGYGGYGGGYGGWGGYPVYGGYYGNCANSLWMLNPAC